MAEQDQEKNPQNKDAPSEINSLLKEMIGKDKSVMNIAATPSSGEKGTDKKAAPATKRLCVG